MHSYGIAVDINSEHNVLCVAPPANADLVNHPFVFAQDHPVVLAFQKCGFFWGGDFHARKDTMHFQYVTGC